MKYHFARQDVEILVGLVVPMHRGRRAGGSESLQYGQPPFGVYRRELHLHQRVEKPEGFTFLWCT